MISQKIVVSRFYSTGITAPKCVILKWVITRFPLINIQNILKQTCTLDTKNTINNKIIDLNKRFLHFLSWGAAHTAVTV